MIVVFDSNVWLKELGLRSGAGSAVRFYLNQLPARLAIPEVVQLEVEHKLNERLAEHIEKIRRSHSQLLTVFSRLKEVVLPSEDEVAAVSAELFSSLDVAMIEIPFTLDSARSALLKAVRGEAPNGKKREQFRDAVIWADCLEMLSEDAVTFVTDDPDFYEARKYEKGLAKNLRKEADSKPHEFVIHRSITDLLEAIATGVSVDEDALADAFIEAHRESVMGTLDRHGFALARRNDTTHTLYATEDASVLFLDFQMEFECEDLTGEGRANATLRLKGDGTYRPSTGGFEGLRNFGERLTHTTSDGEEKVIQNRVMLAGTATIGHREVIHEIRYRLHDDRD